MLRFNIFDYVKWRETTTSHRQLKSKLAEAKKELQTAKDKIGKFLKYIGDYGCSADLEKIKHMISTFLKEK
jgi:hypothetical protein